MTVLCNQLCRIGGKVDQNFHGRDEDPDCMPEGFYIKASVLAAILHQIERGQVAGRVIEEHVFGTRVGGIDPIRIGTGVPIVDGSIILHTGIGAGPGGIGDLLHQVAGLERLIGLIGGAQFGLPFSIALECFHKVIGDADRVIRILSGNRLIGLAVKIGVAEVAENHGPSAPYTTLGEVIRQRRDDIAVADVV